MRLGLAFFGMVFGIATWAILSLWAPSVEIGFFLRTLPLRAVLGIVGVVSIILATRLAVPFASHRTRLGLAWFGVAIPLIVLGGCAALVLFRIVGKLAAAPNLPADIIASNAADATLLVSLGLLSSAAALGLHRTSLSRHNVVA